MGGGCRTAQGKENTPKLKRITAGLDFGSELNLKKTISTQPFGRSKMVAMGENQFPTRHRGPTWRIFWW